MPIKYLQDSFTLAHMLRIILRSQEPVLSNSLSFAQIGGACS